ncbi:DENN domain-containing protein 1A [Holothuria leucospilota]|uniref:DENN domain-containing protein 1A n=1 Tax=Holothuria leucospilota TaxID=206669 RepID=A0A9Q1C6G8_HOLLE|nr:DENN domain-containing protein 1A [Holothuria leucospilota]
MGCRLELNPEHIFECFFEVEAPSEESKEPKIVRRFPEDYKDEVVDKELPKFCFPCDLSRFNPAGQFFTFVLIGLDNKQRFGFCRHPPGAKTCLCILSHLPWFEICYKMLNSLAEFKYAQQSSAGSKLLTQLYNLDVPLPGQVLRLTVSEKGSKTEFSFQCPDPRALPRIPENRNITEFFSAVDGNNMMLLFVSLLYERRVLITSEKLSRLTACVHGAASLLFPLFWQHIYIPVMPAHLIDYTCAPMPFLVGVHSSFMPRVRSNPIDEVVILNADTNEIENPFNDVATLPQDVVKSLKNNLKNTDKITQDGVHLAKSFLKTMVCLIGGYKHALKLREGGPICFSQESFLESRPPHMKECLERLLQMQHFTQFIDNRVDTMNAGDFVDDAFENEVSLSGDVYKEHLAGSSKLKDVFDSTKGNTKKGIQFLQTKAKEVKQHAKEIKVPDVNPEAMKQYWLQTKDLAKDGISDIKKKMTNKSRDTDDSSLDTRSLSNIHALTPPSHVVSSSAPASPNSSPQFERTAFNKIAVRQRPVTEANGKSKYQTVLKDDKEVITEELTTSRPRSGALDGSDAEMISKRTSASEKSRQYKVINLDETGQEADTISDDFRPESTHIDLVGDVTKALEDMGIRDMSIRGVNSGLV